MIRALRDTARALVGMRVAAVVIAGSIAIGVGANTIVFSWMQSVVFRPIDGVRDASAFLLVEPMTDRGVYQGTSWLEYRDVREQVRSVRDLIASRMAPLYVGQPGEVARANGQLVSGNFFTALGLRPAVGRLLQPEDAAAPGREPVVVISYDYWQTHFDGDPAVAGRRLRINGQPLAIAGVAPEGFHGTVMQLRFDMWLPATMAPVLFRGSRELDDREERGYSLIGRLAPEATRASAQRELDEVMRELARLYPRANGATTAQVLPFWQAPRGPQRMLAASLGVLQAIMLLVLLAVCGNAATLLLARASTRQREFGIRLALGAPRWRIAGLLLRDSLALAVIGAAAGVLLAIWSAGALTGAAPFRVRGIPISLQATVDASALVFAAVLALAGGLIAGVVPAIQIVRANPRLLLANASSHAPGRGRVRRVLVGVEAALAAAVLVAAGLFLRDFADARTADPGFQQEGVLLAEYDLTGRRDDVDAARIFAAEVLRRLRQDPSIAGAAMATSVPLDIHGLPIRSFTVEGRARSDAAPDHALVNTVTTGYFALMGIPFASGRDFADLEDASASPEVIVNEEFVRRFLGGLEPLQRRVTIGGRSAAIVGVVRNSVNDAFGEPPLPVIYRSFRDSPPLFAEIHARPRAGAASSIAPAIRRIVSGIDPEVTVFEVRTLREHIDMNLIFQRVPARMFAVLGPLLLLLAAAGIHAAVSYTVSSNVSEIGVRLALGATPARVSVEVLGAALEVVCAGALAGWVAAFVAALNLKGAIPDALVLIAAPALLVAVAALAAWLPARRAASLDPATVLSDTCQC